VTGIMAALIGLGTILPALTLVWMVSVKRRDTSIADQRQEDGSPC
jgi:hypothetical protein